MTSRRPVRLPDVEPELELAAPSRHLREAWACEDRAEARDVLLQAIDDVLDDCERHGLDGEAAALRSAAARVRERRNALTDMARELRAVGR